MSLNDTPSDAQNNDLSRHFTREKLAEILGFNSGQLGLMMMSRKTHAVITETGASNCRMFSDYAAGNATPAPFQECEEIIYTRKNEEPGSPHFWLELRIKGLNYNRESQTFDPVMGIKCTQHGRDEIEVSEPWLTSALDRPHTSLSDTFFYRATLGNERIAAFESLVCDLIGQEIKPLYTPPLSPYYRHA